MRGGERMEKAVGKASASHRSTDVYCNFEFAVRKTHSRSKASSRASIKRSGTGRKER